VLGAVGGDHRVRPGLGDLLVEQRDAILHLSIRDDGARGADPAGGSGLIGLRDRVQALGGSTEVNSRPEKARHSSSNFRSSPTDRSMPT
jgi:signal transduction histidine kinase